LHPGIKLHLRLHGFLQCTVGTYKFVDEANPLLTSSVPFKTHSTTLKIEIESKLVNDALLSHNTTSTYRSKAKSGFPHQSWGGRRLAYWAAIFLRRAKIGLTRQTAVIENVHICISYALAYLKYLNKYSFTAYVTANVKYVNPFVCMTYLHKIVVFRILDSAHRKRICGP
jgi:hypothetical protein